MAVVLLTGVACPPVVAQQRVVGLVVDQRLGVPIDGATVRLLDQEGRTMDSVATADGGRFAMLVDPATPFRMQVRASGYATHVSVLMTEAPADGLRLSLELDAPARVAGDDTVLEVTGGLAPVYGWLQDEHGGRPVSDASVELVRGGERTTSSVHGFFAMEAGTPGEDTLIVRHLSFSERRLPVRLREGLSLQVFIDLSSDPLPMEGFEINVRPSLRARQMIEHHRRREIRSGFFMSSEDLEGRGASRLGELMQGLPSLRVDMGSPSESPQIEFRGRRCTPRVWIDGREVRPAGAAMLELREIRGADLEALEVYRGGEAPLEFGGGVCVTILAWTRRG